MGCISSRTSKVIVPRSKTPLPRTPTPPPRSPTPPPRSPTPPPRSPTPPPPTPPPRESTADFASDCIDIKIDNANDEKEIVATEDGYHDPVPGDQVDGSVKQKHNWFEDDDFNNASDDADLFQTEITVDDENINLDTMSDTTSFISNPTRSAKPKLAFDDVDKHAKQASSTLLHSFDNLLQYLKNPFDGDGNRKIKIARAIVVWMSSQQDVSADYGVATTDTPRGLIQYLKEHRMTYTTCYAILCRKAGLQCAVIKGYVKAAGYEPGNTIVPEASWTAVHVECGWQLVHPFWICRALYGHNLGGWVKVEEDGKSIIQRERVSEGVVRNTFQERYFMPDPEEFIYECAAKDLQWQLASNVISKTRFIEMPYLLPPFFGIGFELINDSKTESKCVLECKDGFCNIKLKRKPANAHMIMLSYELFLKDQDNGSENGCQKESNMARMVFNSRAKEIFDFEIRFPTPGTYKIVIYGGPYKCPRLRLCEFKIICHKGLEANRALLPLECSKIGWGPGPVSVEAGLITPTRISGLIPVSKSEKKTTIKFHLQDLKKMFTASIHGEVGGQSKTFDVLVEIKSKEFHQLQVAASIPTEGEFGLSIHLKEQPERSVCNYLLSTFVSKGMKANERNAKKKLEERITENVDPQQWKAKISNAEHAIERCLKEKIPANDEDIVAAKTVLDFLRCKDKLRDCKLRSNLGVTRKTLELVSHYSYKNSLTKEIEEIKQLELRLTAWRSFTRLIPTLKESYKEVIDQHDPAEEVVDVFRSLLLLLGYSGATEWEWSIVQGRLKRLTEKSSALGEMKTAESEKLNNRTKSRVMSDLQRYTENQIRSVNGVAHSVYVWMMNILNSRDTM
ncbi:uncharacterized protein LOC132760351 isoform X2 [Ruditapes philippinarum]|nr:uncharacterized protein LOC132760351 isoform X2 [Ruditapes philippinarum]XP_060608315.1 uncharacterized protein LOC132760351 isoform X2 [Ruditapes philippinarum]